jgi:3-methyladenine DNA glycosylase AlkD
LVTDSLYAPYTDEKYRDFAKGLSPTDTLERKGIRIPVLRKLSKAIRPEEIDITYHEDVILKGLAIGHEKTKTEVKLDKLTTLLPFLSSWDQTDTIVSAFRPKDSEKELFYSYFASLTERKEVYPKRLGIVWLMTNRKLYDRKESVDRIIRADDEGEYYISMAVAWALSFFIIDDNSLLGRLGEVSAVTRKRTEQKLRDSYRFNPRR